MAPRIGEFRCPRWHFNEIPEVYFHLGDNTQSEVWQFTPAGNESVSDLAGLWKIAKKDIQLEGEGFKITVSLQRRDISALSA